jgi:hypothetical protein
VGAQREVADASECNETFKMCVTRAKRVIYDLRPHGMKQFTTTDVIPIINKSFFDSYGNVENAKKAIANRGWFPATYALLTVPAIAKTKIIDDSIDDSIPVPPAAPILNLEVGAAGKMTDKLLTDELRKVGRKDKLRREREDTAQQHELAQEIKGLSRVTSGGLASLRHYCLDTNVHQAVRERVIAGGKKESLQERKRIRSAIAIVP